MKRNDFKKIIKIRSQWQFTGDNYKLPSGEPISVYVRKLVESQMNVDSLAILKNGDLSFATGGNWNDTTKEFEGYVLMPAFQENETCEFDKMEKRIDALVYELVQKQ
nr:MAG TPA: hypothetical protein [Siphoviridae sp. ctQHO9]